MLSWAFAAGAVVVLPLCLVWMLELNPGTTYLDHLPAAIPMLGALVLLIAPSRGTGPDGALPDEHVDVFRYAIRSGVLPIASLFSDWRCELERRRSLLELVRRVLPTATGTACALDLYGALLDPAGRVFFLASAVAAATFGVAVYSLSSVRLGNIGLVGERLRLQTRLLEVLH